MLKMAPLVLDVSLLRFTLLKKKFIFENETFFIREKYGLFTSDGARFLGPSQHKTFILFQLVQLVGL